MKDVEYEKKSENIFERLTNVWKMNNIIKEQKWRVMSLDKEVGT